MKRRVQGLHTKASRVPFPYQLVHKGKVMYDRKRAGVGGGVHEKTAAECDSVTSTCTTELFGIRIGT